MRKSAFSSLFKALYNSYRQAFENSIHNITLTDWQVLQYACERKNEEIYQKDIEAYFSIPRSTATGILQSLERAGFLSRETAKKDSRLKRLVLSEKGLALYSQNTKVLRQIERRFFAGISEEERDTLFHIMKKIFDNTH